MCLDVSYIYMLVKDIFSSFLYSIEFLVYHMVALHIFMFRYSIIARENIIEILEAKLEKSC